MNDSGKMTLKQVRDKLRWLSDEAYESDISYVGSELSNCADSISAYLIDANVAASLPLANAQGQGGVPTGWKLVKVSDLMSIAEDDKEGWISSSATNSYRVDVLARILQRKKAKAKAILAPAYDDGGNGNG